MTIHKSVLLNETIDGLNLKEGMTVADVTLGGGGHSREILRRIGPSGKLVAIDRDEEALERFRKRTEESKIDNFFLANIKIIKANFAEIKNVLEDLGIAGVDGIAADLGFSSDQMEDIERGLSFQKEGPLDMRLDRSQELTAHQIVNEYPQEELEYILKNYGEEKFAKNIVKKIIEARQDKTIETTTELAEIVRSAIPEKFKYGKIPRKIRQEVGPRGRHPATKTFQALRIETNNELESLKKFVPDAIGSLKAGGRLAIISFHSLEDRIVKNIFRENARGCICPPEFPECRCGRKPVIKIITKKPIGPSAQEIDVNPRARSAKLRICEKI